MVDSLCRLGAVWRGGQQGAVCLSVAQAEGPVTQLSTAIVSEAADSSTPSLLAAHHHVTHTNTSGDTYLHIR